MYTILGAVKVDILLGRRIVAQRIDDSLDVTFPDGDGSYETAAVSTVHEGEVLTFLNYQRCLRFAKSTVPEAS